jgi:hypothetical protein
MNKLLHTIGLVSIMALSACASPSTTPKPVDLNFAAMQAVPLSVGAVQVLNASAPSIAPKNLMLKNASPAAALERYAAQRLHAAGGQGTLNFTIQQASIVSREVVPTKTGSWIKDNVKLGNPTEHTVTMKVGINLTGRPGQPDMTSAFSMERKKTIPAEESLQQRDYEINQLIEYMVRDMDASIVKALNDNMHVVVGPGPLTFGNPMPMNDANNQVPVMLNNAR